MLPSSAEASADLSTSAPEITSEGSTSKARSRPSSSVARMRLLSVTMLYCGPKPRTETFCPSPPVVRVIVMPGRCSSESATSASGNRPSSSALMESSTTVAFFLMSRDFSRLARSPVTTISSSAGPWSFAPAVEAAGELAAGVSAAADPSTSAAIAPVPAANGSQIAIKVGFRLGTLRLPVPLTRWFFDTSMELQTKENETFVPALTFVFLRLMLLLFSNKSIVVTQPFMNKGPLTRGKTSRRQFVRLAGGLALALRHGLLPAQTGTDAPQPEARGVATLEDTVLRIEWDAKLHARVSRRAGPQWVAMTSWGPSEYLLGADGRSGDARHIADFAIRHQARSSIADTNGPATRITLSRTSVNGVEKTVQATLYERHPGIALVRVSYRNSGAGILSFRSWSNGDSRVLATGTRTPAFWCYSGATYEDRRDWVQPV